MVIKIEPRSTLSHLSDPLSVHIHLNSQAPAGFAEVIPPEAAEAANIIAEDESPYTVPLSPEAVEIDPHYDRREGYQPDFLGVAVPLPNLTSQVLGEPSVRRDTREPELTYHHFSIVMNRERRFAFYTAVNIDGDLAQSLERDGDRWLFDPRIPKEDQVGEELYRSNDLDRGHLVRRLDPCWGNSARTRLFAASDTFHFTNCSPQHARFNQNQQTWAGLENYILTRTVRGRGRVSVFSGPVFSSTDPGYRGVQLPKQFWKVVAFVPGDGNLAASAYVLSQRALIADLEAELALGAYRTFQVSVAKVEELTGLDFGVMRDVDVFGWRPNEEVEVAFFSDLVLPNPIMGASTRVDGPLRGPAFLGQS